MANFLGLVWGGWGGLEPLASSVWLILLANIGGIDIKKKTCW